MSGTFLGIEHMSTQKGGNGGSIINMSSLIGNQLISIELCTSAVFYYAM